MDPSRSEESSRVESVGLAFSFFCLLTLVSLLSFVPGSLLESLLFSCSRCLDFCSWLCSWVISFPSPVVCFFFCFSNPRKRLHPLQGPSLCCFSFNYRFILICREGRLFAQKSCMDDGSISHFFISMIYLPAARANSPVDVFRAIHFLFLLFFAGVRRISWPLILSMNPLCQSPS